MFILLAVHSARYLLGMEFLCKGDHRTEPLLRGTLVSPPEHDVVDELDETLVP